MSRRIPTENLVALLQSARQRTLELVEGLSAEQLIGPKLRTVNPLQWEIGHVGWFHEYFILRRIYGYEPLLERGDGLYDSIAIPHDRRWDLPLYSLEETLDYLARVQARLIQRLEGGLAGEEDSFIYQFTAFHEDMHDEAFLWTRQTLGYPAPVFEPDAPREHVNPGAGPLPGDVDLPGGRFLLGSPPDAPFLFDNEKWAHEVEVLPFRMARAPVTQSEFRNFVEDGGYQRREYWDDEGWRWRAETDARHPAGWRRSGAGQWQLRRFDTWQALPPHEPVVHVCWHEANAYCRWARRRLPTEAEWEFAASMRPAAGGALVKARYPWGDERPQPRHANLDGFALGCVDAAAHREGDNAFGVRQLVGNVWEWTQDAFGPYPGFTPDAYKEYSEPLFGTTKVLRGGAWTTRARLITATYRNFFGAERRDVFAGFRTCSLA
ncbi:MAG TPA: selenoneine synthase SenA [Gammaproteobacteria bacterium]|nr:selenoneine synthase SenA [Gammaproteobacteria bacterium]